jgi:hypothetical protein
MYIIDLDADLKIQINTRYIFFHFRIATLLSVIVLSLDWKNGVLVVTSSLCLLLFSAPFLEVLFSKYFCRTRSNLDRTNYFLPITVFVLDPLLVCDSKSASRLSRVKNKGISVLLMMTTVVAEALVIWNILPVSSQDVW